jgi:hypothetical protein
MWGLSGKCQRGWQAAVATMSIQKLAEPSTHGAVSSADQLRCLVWLQQLSARQLVFLYYVTIGPWIGSGKQLC